MTTRTGAATGAASTVNLNQAVHCGELPFFFGSVEYVYGTTIDIFAGL